MTATTHPQATAALRAIELKRTCGPFVARRYATRHGARSLYRLALQLEAATRAGF